jgi:hypothetical protein
VIKDSDAEAARMENHRNRPEVLAALAGRTGESIRRSPTMGVDFLSDELGVLGEKLTETGAKLQRMFEELQREHIELEKLERIRKVFVINVGWI